MSTPNGILQLLVRCPRCDGRNAVDLRKQGLAKRARCGRCGEPLPRRLPAPLLLLVVTTLVVGAGLTHFAMDAMRLRRATSRRALIERYLLEKRAIEAVELLPSPRVAASEDGQLARRVALALAAPILAADADPGSGRASVEEAVALGDQLVEDHEKDLPELLAVVDDPLRHLQARGIAFDIVEDAQQAASETPPDLARVERALQDAAVAAVDSAPDVAAAVERLSDGIRAKAVLERARTLVGRRPEEARQLLVKTAQRLPPPRPTGHHGIPPAPEEPAPATLLAQTARIRDAVSQRDFAQLSQVVHLRPDASWDGAAREELDRDVRRACQALASLGAERAADAIDPDARAEALLAAMTCDEILPREFLAAGRAALAETLVEAARRGGSLEDALLAWTDVASPRRDRDMAALGCLAEARGAHSTSVLAWARVQSPQALGLILQCRDEPVEAMPPPTLPALGYPAPAP